MGYIGSKEHLENARKAGLLGLKRVLENKENRISEYNINPNKCIFCDKIFEYEKKHKKFCNSSCAAKYNNKNRKVSDKTKFLIGSKLRGRKQTEENKNKIRGEKNGNWKGGKYKIYGNIINYKNEYSFERNCVYCGNKFIAKKISKDRTSRSKYCSKKCRDNHASDKIKEKVKQGTHNGWSTRNIISYPEQFFMTVLNNNNIKFKHNYPVNKKNLGLNSDYNYFLDFFIEDKNIDLEIDGKQHKSRTEHDNFRDKILIENGYVVYRIKWKNINTKKGKEYIKNEIDKFLKFYNN
jgi:very-short-patch-repair endonuclease